MVLNLDSLNLILKVGNLMMKTEKLMFPQSEDNIK